MVSKTLAIYFPFLEIFFKNKKFPPNLIVTTLDKFTLNN
jgi:hypothetical protein